MLRPSGPTGNVRRRNDGLDVVLSSLPLADNCPFPRLVLRSEGTKLHEGLNSFAVVVGGVTPAGKFLPPGRCKWCSQGPYLAIPRSSHRPSTHAGRDPTNRRPCRLQREVARRTCLLLLMSIRSTGSCICTPGARAYGPLMQSCSTANLHVCC